MDTIEKALSKFGDDFGKKGSVPDKSNFPKSPNRNPEEYDIFLNLDKMHEVGMLTPQSGRNEIAEEYRHIKRPLLKNVLEQSNLTQSASNIIMVTSALPGEGKTYTSINLAMSIAMEMDHTCLLVDSDVAKPSVMRAVGLYDGSQKGLVDYLSDPSLDLADIMLRTNVPKLNIIPAGSVDAHATELLSSEHMRRLVKELSERYHDRIIIFDTPPLLATTESHVLMSLAGQVVLVVEAMKTQYSAIKQAVEFLPKDKYVGLILNKSRTRSSYGYSYGGYGYGYGYALKTSKKGD